MDIQKCTAIDPEGHVCLIAHQCHRHTGPSSERQAWGPPGPDFDPKDGCELYIPGDGRWKPVDATRESR